MRKIKAKAFDELYQSLGTKDGGRHIYRLTKCRERKTRDLDQVKCVKDEEGKVLVKEQDITYRWKGYFASGRIYEKHLITLLSYRININLIILSLYYLFSFFLT